MSFERRLPSNNDTNGDESIEKITTDDDHWTKLFVFLRASTLHMIMTEEDKPEYRDEIISCYRLELSFKPHDK